MARPSAIGLVYALIAASTGVVGAAGWSYDPEPAPASSSPSLSADGTTLAFSSAASTLVPGDTNRATDVFVKDLATGAVTRASTAADGTQACGTDPTLSADGTRVAFRSGSPNLVPGDTNGEIDVFVKDLRSGAVLRASSTAAGAQAHGAGPNDQWPPRPSSAQGCRTAYGYAPARNLALSADGTKVAFVSSARDLVPGDTNRRPDVFVKDLASGAITRVSTTASGAQARRGAEDWAAAISADGSTVAFLSADRALVPGPGPKGRRLFVKNLRTGAISRVADGYDPALSADGSRVAFLTDEPLVRADHNRVTDAYVVDLRTGVPTRASTTARGGALKRATESMALSADGTWLVFGTSGQATPDDRHFNPDVFVKDLRTGAVTRVSTAWDGGDLGLPSAAGAVANGGGTVALWLGQNVYVRDERTRTLVRATPFPDDRPFLVKVWTQLL